MIIEKVEIGEKVEILELCFTHLYLLILSMIEFFEAI